ncbi:MAG: hypothetical protein QXK33_04945 [Candidatus Bathyarchaeia archaeon]
MNDVIKVRDRKYIRLGHVTLAAVEPSFERLIDDEDFVEKVKAAYLLQVCINNGWGFTVRHKGYRIRFDLQNTTGWKLPRIYEGVVLEEPETVQKTLLEVKENA